MSNHLNNPREYDAVLGGENPAPANAAVLGGGIEKVKRRLLSQVVEHRISALSEALNYDKEGLRLLIQALSDPEILVQLTAYKLLQNREELEVKFTLQNYKIYFLPHVYGLYKTLSI